MKCIALIFLIKEITLLQVKFKFILKIKINNKYILNNLLGSCDKLILIWDLIKETCF